MPVSPVSADAKARQAVDMAQAEAIRRHGPLKGGMDRWIHHLQEECQEAVDEMLALKVKHSPIEVEGIKVNLVCELAQVAQLAISMISLVYQGKEKEGEETWGLKQ